MHWWLVRWTERYKIQFNFLVLPQICCVPLGESLHLSTRNTWSAMGFSVGRKLS